MNNCDNYDNRDSSAGRSQTSPMDQPIIKTADDAMVAKLATTHAGYYVDPFLDAFCRSPSSGDDNDGGGDSRSERFGTTPPAAAASRCSRSGGRRRIVQPLIKRGTHARVCVMDRVVSTFLKKLRLHSDAAACQIVVLGAGKDTSYFRYRNGNIMGLEQESEETKTKTTQTQTQTQRQTQTQTQTQTTTTTRTATDDPPQPQVHWYEVDHFSVIKEKATSIRKSTLLKSYCPLLVKTPIGYESQGGGSVGLGTPLGAARWKPSFSASSPAPAPTPASSTYHLIGHDLRDSPERLMTMLDLDPALPTLFLMECVSMYVPITASENLLEALSVSADTVYIACYEPILGRGGGDDDSSSSSSSSSGNRGDPFGRVMEQNLVKMRVASPDSCLLQTRTLRDQLEKLVRCTGFVRAVGCDMWSAYETIVTGEQRKRASQSEFMDEFEEWILIMKHYCFVIAGGGRSSSRSPSRSPNERSGLDLMTVLGPNSSFQERASSVGWMEGKCLEVDKDPSVS